MSYIPVVHLVQGYKLLLMNSAVEKTYEMNFIYHVGRVR